jgi:hypothetical protein
MDYTRQRTGRRALEDLVEKSRVVGCAPTMKHWSPELVRVFPTTVSICKGEPPNKLGIPTREAFFNRIFETREGAFLGRYHDEARVRDSCLLMLDGSNTHSHRHGYQRSNS